LSLAILANRTYGFLVGRRSPRDSVTVTCDLRRQSLEKNPNLRHL
jgi:hypothetical protein